MPYCDLTDVLQMELNFRGGDVIIVYGHMDEDGFFVGEANGRRGLVPSNFLTPEPPGAITSLGPGGATVATTSVRSVESRADRV